MRYFAIFLTFTLAVCCAFCPVLALAETVDWVRITQKDTHLYATADATKAMFLLEKSYYAKVLSQTENMYFVSILENANGFAQITGYVFQDEVELCEKTPINPLYPTEMLTVCGNSASLLLAPTPSSEVVITATNTQQVAYYGRITSYGKNWYYVRYANLFGYVPTDTVTTPNIPLHPTPLVTYTPPTTVEPTLPADTQEPTEKITPTAEIVLIVFVSLLALAITFALFLPVKSKGVFEQDI